MIIFQVKVVHVYVDGVCVSPERGHLVRRAPGHVQYNFGQIISFQEPEDINATTAVSEINETLPRGCILIKLINRSYLYS